ncbi:DMT family transporter [Falsirhodobacter algicola]|uniref:EamA family transporter n=1 Tax=Falsirhodobacter algicola TaxID=2692330 RepID=A0A8J8MW93_9RHOB|nr:DMT family transporter [Falsirhodobacter algicola]QUS37308.1 EamA family transporter [Falsirhodobacter algicola]
MNLGAAIPATDGAARARGIAAVLVASALWGTTGTVAALAPGVAAATMGAAAMGVGGLLQALRAAPDMARSAPQLRRHAGILPLAALAVAVYPLAFYSSMRAAGVIVGTAVSIGSAPLFSALVEMVADGLRPGRRWLAGALMGIAGITLLTAGGHGTAGAGTGHAALGVGLGLVAGLTYALYSWIAGRAMRAGLPGGATMGTIFGGGGLLLMPVLLLTGGPLLASWGNAAAGLWMALGPMFLGYVCFGHGLARIRASEATTLTLTEPVIAALLAMAVLHERLSGPAWVGVALVAGCMLCIALPQRRLAAGNVRHPAPRP